MIKVVRFLILREKNKLGVIYTWVNFPGRQFFQLNKLSKKQLYIYKWSGLSVADKCVDTTFTIKYFVQNNKTKRPY